ncbi:unnamed protein product [Nesidiocoris tenuis]|uniref:Uncharacterized protein n=1 Tax=Nesidiocoris tenuis TaxID=355587 RepID=A0A6H5HCN5_9HEMI|nr:unnamed protein product [Nesidiocoris tenuis]
MILLRDNRQDIRSLCRKYQQKVWKWFPHGTSDIREDEQSPGKYINVSHINLQYCCRSSILHQGEESALKHRPKLLKTLRTIEIDPCQNSHAADGDGYGIELNAYTQERLRTAITMPIMCELEPAMNYDTDPLPLYPRPLLCRPPSYFRLVLIYLKPAQPLTIACSELQLP